MEAPQHSRRQLRLGADDIAPKFGERLVEDFGEIGD
jgi:hypothetical protein